MNCTVNNGVIRNEHNTAIPDAMALECQQKIFEVNLALKGRNAAQALPNFKCRLDRITKFIVHFESGRLEQKYSPRAKRCLVT